MKRSTFEWVYRQLANEPMFNPARPHLIDMLASVASPEDCLPMCFRIDSRSYLYINDNQVCHKVIELLVTDLDQERLRTLEARIVELDSWPVPYEHQCTEFTSVVAEMKAILDAQWNDIFIELKTIVLQTGKIGQYFAFYWPGKQINGSCPMLVDVETGRFWPLNGYEFEPEIKELTWEEMDNQEHESWETQAEYEARLIELCLNKDFEVPTAGFEDFGERFSSRIMIVTRPDGVQRSLVIHNHDVPYIYDGKHYLPSAYEEAGVSTVYEALNLLKAQFCK